jgi:hypothetical protein
MGKPFRNVLYLAVQPQISLSNAPGRVDQILTLVPSHEWASSFFADELDGYLAMFKNRIDYFKGGHVEGYDVEVLKADDGARFFVKVTQYGS